MKITDILGKVIGAILGALLTRHPYGLLAGLLIGHAIDKRWFVRLLAPASNNQGALVAPLFGLAGAIAKADGQVSQIEIDAATRLMERMGLDAKQRQRAIAAFNKGKQGDFDAHNAARKLREFCGWHGELKLMLVDVLVSVAIAEGQIHAQALAILSRVARSLDLADSLLEQIIARRGGRSNNGKSRINDPYQVLGLATSASESEIRSAYRKLMTKFHPDKILANTKDEVSIRQAQDRASEINAAYEQIKLQRGYK